MAAHRQLQQWTRCSRKPACRVLMCTCVSRLLLLLPRRQPHKGDAPGVAEGGQGKVNTTCSPASHIAPYRPMAQPACPCKQRQQQTAGASGNDPSQHVLRSGPCSRSCRPWCMVQQQQYFGVVPVSHEESLGSRYSPTTPYPQACVCPGRVCLQVRPDAGAAAGGGGPAAGVCGGGNRCRQHVRSSWDSSSRWAASSSSPTTA